MLSTAFVLFLGATTPPAEPIEGRLCIAAPKADLTAGTCRAVSGTSFEIDAASQKQLFLWTSAGEKWAQIGVVPATATSVTLDSPDQREVKLTFRGEPTRGWPLDTHVTVRGQEEWRFTVLSRDTGRFERLIVPAGRYAIEVRADHHRPMRRLVDVTKAEQAGRLLKAWLDPLLRVRGKIIDSEEKPIGFATITLPDGSLCTTADAQGMFTCELPERAPDAVAINASGYGTREMKVDRSVADVDIGAIQLSKGQRLIVQVSRDAADTRPLKVSLLSGATDRYERSRLRSQELKTGQEKVTFEDISPGRYLIVLAGAEPLERLTVPYEVKAAEDAVAEVTIKPFRLEGRFLFGEEPVRQGKLSISDRERGWREKVEVTPDGKFGGTMWQEGVISAVADIGGPGMSEFVTSPSLGADPSSWEIRIKDRQITGMIVDAATGKPAPRASMNLVAKFVTGDRSTSGTLHSMVTLQPDGSFRILANLPGTYQLKVSAPEYMTKIVDVLIGDDDRTKVVDVALEAGVEQLLEIVSSSGSPLPFVTLLEGVQDDVNPQFILHADHEGKFNLRGRPGETRVLYVVPREGSFAVARVPMPRAGGKAEALRIVVPPAAGSLRVRAIDAEERPVPTRVMVRYNGEFIPPAIIRFVGDRAIGTARSGEGIFTRLPAGTYEVWAVGALADEQQLIASQGTLRPPVRVGLSGGEVPVTIIAPKRAK